MICNIVHDSQTGKRIRFKIRDYGKGIAEENYDKIFQPFHQENAETGTVYGGTGLGLPITAQLVKKLGGDIDVKSQVGKWTEFTVDLPFHGQEITNLNHQLSRMADTVIMVIVARPMTDCPVNKWLTENGLTVSTVTSCDELEQAAQELEAENPNRYYLALMHGEIFDESAYHSFTKNRACQLITFGYQNVAMAAAHVPAPCRVFPSLFLPILGDLTARCKTGCIKKIETTLDSSILLINNQEKFHSKKLGTKPMADSVYGTLRVLIAEDNKINQKVLSKTLNRLGVQKVDVVDNGLKAVSAAAENAYDIIFMVSGAAV